MNKMYQITCQVYRYTDRLDMTLCISHMESGKEVRDVMICRSIGLLQSFIIVQFVCRLLLLLFYAALGCIKSMMMMMMMPGWVTIIACVNKIACNVKRHNCWISELMLAPVSSKIL